MSLRQRYLNILSGIIPAGLVGASLLIGSATPVAANQETAGGAAAARVSERLAAIRAAVSDVAGPGAKAEPQLAWWGNVGWGRPGWRNGGVWRNGGWRNGGWRNGGWHNGWNNFWRNW